MDWNSISYCFFLFCFVFVLNIVFSAYANVISTRPLLLVPIQQHNINLTLSIAMLIQTATKKLQKIVVFCVLCGLWTLSEFEMYIFLYIYVFDIPFSCSGILARKRVRRSWNWFGCAVCTITHYNR